MLGANGFIFPSGETQMSYKGVTVINQQGTRTYGSVLDTRSENGNLGFTTVTFGDANGEVTTQVMPVFLYYSITDNQTGEVVPLPDQQGWFGVASTSGSIVVPNSVEPAAGFPACSITSVGTMPIEFGVFARGADGTESTEKVLYLAKHTLPDGDSSVTVTVDGKPYQAGIDPYNKLIDRVPDDNRVKVVIDN
jgi:hypothetical protein